MNKCSCGATIKGNYSKCYKCKQIDTAREAYDLGYQTGFLAGEKAKAKDINSEITIHRWRRLIHLCHPDKHDNSIPSMEMTTWLTSIKPDEESKS